mmetsp:Transcript_23611/g.21481  ORF Transcript_23611/g.21481 Transcript_23611/m.21481 type:complete len:121 (-) Transcript_23611:125-487(-)
MTTYFDDFEKKLIEPINLKLGNNSLLFKSGKGWIIESSDIDKANDDLINMKKLYNNAMTEIANLNDDIKGLTDTKAVVLELLIEERQRNHQLEQEIAAYKAELKENYKTILDIKQQYQKD